MKVWSRIKKDGTVVNIPISKRVCGGCRWSGSGLSNTYPYRVGDPCPECGAPDEVIGVLVRELRRKNNTSLRRAALRFAIDDLTRRSLA